ncbi:hypothetical protein [Streptomyces variegatus]|uniref:hypothetical protein n=1 Tax=Streptomyces variegatus TaxID=284040 RepID=UPI003C2E1BCC
MSAPSKFSKAREEHGTFLLLLKRVQKTRRLLVMVVFAMCIGIPVTFAVGDEDRLRMSDDFAAMISAALVLLLTLGFLEMDRSVKRAQGMADAQLAAAESGIPLPGTEKVLSPETRNGATLGVTALLLWLFGSLLMGSALVLTFLWAAIDGRGPARWLAWYALVSTCLGLGGLLGATVAKAMSDLEALKDTYLTSLGTHQIRANRAGCDRGEEDEAVPQ